MKKFLPLIVLTAAMVTGISAAADDEVAEFTRHKHLVELVTSQGCAYCPWGDRVLELLAEIRPDIARVSIHNNLNASDQFRTFKADAIGNLLRYDAMPEAAFDRTPYQGVFMQVVSVPPEYSQAKAQAFSDQLDTNVTTPVLADVVIDADYDQATRKLTVTVSGDIKSNFFSTFGTAANSTGLTIYLTEDSLVAWQQDGSTRVEDFVHNNVFRETMTNYKGDALMWNDEKTHYQNTYAYTLKAGWMPENMNIVAFVHRSTVTTPVQEVINCQSMAIRDLLEQPVEPVLGDVDGNGSVGIEDVNAVINVMLGAAQNPAADVDAGGSVGIEDVNAVINIMLGKR